jgi:hypothetical protein
MGFTWLGPGTGFTKTILFKWLPGRVAMETLQTDIEAINNIIAFLNMFKYGTKPNKKPSQKNDGFFMKQGELERKTF